MGIAALELTHGTKVRMKDRELTVESVVNHPAGTWIRWREGGGNSLVALLAYGAVIAA